MFLTKVTCLSMILLNDQVCNTETIRQNYEWCFVMAAFPSLPRTRRIPSPSNTGLSLHKDMAIFIFQSPGLTWREGSWFLVTLWRASMTAGKDSFCRCLIISLSATWTSLTDNFAWGVWLMERLLFTERRQCFWTNQFLNLSNHPNTFLNLSQEENRWNNFVRTSSAGWLNAVWMYIWTSCLSSGSSVDSSIWW